MFTNADLAYGMHVDIDMAVYASHVIQSQIHIILCYVSHTMFDIYRDQAHGMCSVFVRKLLLNGLKHALHHVMPQSNPSGQPTSAF